MKEHDSPSLIMAIDHVQVAGPAGCEDVARSFYVDLLGMTEIAKPEALQSRGGAWFQSGKIQIHIGIEESFIPARKAHPAFAVCDLWKLKAKLRAAGVICNGDISVPGVERFYASDPFGNRLEFLQKELSDSELLRKHGLSIAPLHESMLPSAKRVIADGVKEFFLKPGETADAESILKSYEERGLFDDLDSFETIYTPPDGVFLLLLDDQERVVGMGGIRRFDEGIAELKRMWYLPEYRSRGLGKMLAVRLIDFAREAGYGSIRLDSGSNLHQALALYRKLGFREIENYNGATLPDVFMELPL